MNAREYLKKHKLSETLYSGVFGSSANKEKHSGCLSYNMIKEKCSVLKIPKTIKPEELTEDVIKEHFRKMARKLHPDLSGYESRRDFDELAKAKDRLLEYINK